MQPTHEQYNWDDEFQSSPEYVEAIEFLLDHGAQFVLCRPKKTPLWKKWQRKRPTRNEILNHWGPVGVIPWSVGMTVLDADIIPNALCLMELLKRCAHITVLQSQKADRAHIYLRDDMPRTNGRFEAFGVRGDIRSASGYAILWGDAAMRLDQKTPGGRLGLGQMEEWLIFKGGKLKVKRNPVRKRGRGLKNARKHLLTAGGLPNLTAMSDVQVGERNECLFETLRLWSYGRRRGDDYGEWRGLVRECARKINDHITVPLPDEEVDRTADSVADFCWSSLHEVEPRQKRASSEEQARCGRASGRARRWQSGHLRDHPRPWERHGISRSNYYRRLKEFRDAYPGERGRPPDRIFTKQTEEEAQAQRCAAAKVSASRRTARAAAARCVGEMLRENADGDASRAFQRVGRNHNHQQRPRNRGRAWRTGTPDGRATERAGDDLRGRTIPVTATWHQLSPRRRERQAVANLIASLQNRGADRGQTAGGTAHDGEEARPADRAADRGAA